ncbi:hypothetical protein PUR59_04195 [Streptomyces sp. SP18ES09]|uniref:hypothetical protein n=1 Tax=Streptomyces sp. SP18ES09 TaxID=3002532 RepID=UPI002E77942B|nr:hypothetical protein [Streptomyces sp. SP18ES09]MEE1814221.1 hypothetical protein [Streptomyces sp. SP18ES09]
MIGRFPVPGYPRWTGAVAGIGAPYTGPDGQMTVDVSFHLTRRARWYVAARLFLGKGVPGAA